MGIVNIEGYDLATNNHGLLASGDGGGTTEGPPKQPHAPTKPPAPAPAPGEDDQGEDGDGDE